MSAYLSVCVSVCPRGYFQNHTRDLYPNKPAVVDSNSAPDAVTMATMTCVLIILPINLKFLCSFLLPFANNFEIVSQNYAL